MGVYLMEIERKFLIGKLPDLADLDLHRISQGYISTSPDIRIRKDNEKYFLTMKGNGTLCREEHTLEITSEEYNNLLAKCVGRTIEKLRYYAPLKSGHIAEIDIYTGELDGLQVVEVEFKSGADAACFIPPEWFGAEVTHDMRYRNSSLAISKTVPTNEEGCT